MTEPDSTAPAALTADLPPEPPLPSPEASAAPAWRGVHALPWLAGAAILLLAAGLGFLWQRQIRSDATVARMQARLTALESRPEPAAPESAASGPAAATAAAVATLARQVAALAARAGVAAPPGAGASAGSAPGPQIAAQSRQDAAALAQVARLHATVTDQSRDLALLGQRLSALHDRVAALTAERAAGTTATTTDLTALHRALIAETTARAALAARLRALATQAGQTARVARLTAARSALAAGVPLGPIPGAPPALARFANTAPPTEAALRLAFTAAARAARAASRPSVAGKPWFEQLWIHAVGLVSVRRGDQVLLGNPAAGPLAAARIRLNAGDLAGALAALAPLDPPAAHAMAGWQAQARALLAARAALDAMGQGG